MSDELELTLRIARLEAENKRLREALQTIADKPQWSEGHQNIAKAALSEGGGA